MRLHGRLAANLAPFLFGSVPIIEKTKR